MISNYNWFSAISCYLTLMAGIRSSILLVSMHFKVQSVQNIASDHRSVADE